MGRTLCEAQRDAHVADSPCVVTNVSAKGDEPPPRTLRFSRALMVGPAQPSSQRSPHTAPCRLPSLHSFPIRPLGTPRTLSTGVFCSYENTFPQDPQVGICLGPYDSPRGGASSHEQGASVFGCVGPSWLFQVGHFDPPRDDEPHVPTSTIENLEFASLVHQILTFHLHGLHCCPVLAQKVEKSAQLPRGLLGPSACLERAEGSRSARIKTREQ